MKSKNAAFTLIEIIVSIALLLLLLVLAVPTVDGIFASGRLQKTLDQFDNFVTEVRDLAVTENRTIVIVWRKKEIVALPDGRTDDPDVEPLKTFTPGDDQVYQFAPTASMEKNPAAEWTFWPNGTCEPAEVGFAGGQGTWRVGYAALGARREILTFITK